jgi:hypothetical protein
MVVVMVVVVAVMMMMTWKRRRQLNWLSLYWSSVCWRWGESELCVRLKQPHLTAHLLHSFFLSFFLSLTHTWLCCDDDHVEYIHAWTACLMKANKKAFSYVFHYLIHIHSLLICLYVKLVWKSLRMRCMVGWLVYNEAVSVVDTQVVFAMCSINSIAACTEWA